MMWICGGSKCVTVAIWSTASASTQGSGSWYWYPYWAWQASVYPHSKATVLLYFCISHSKATVLPCFSISHSKATVLPGFSISHSKATVLPGFSISHSKATVLLDFSISQSQYHTLRDTTRWPWSQAMGWDRSSWPACVKCSVLLASLSTLRRSSSGTVTATWTRDNNAFTFSLSRKIQTHERFKGRLFIRTKHNMHIFGGNPLYQATKRYLNNNGEKHGKIRRTANPLIFWGMSYCQCLLLFVMFWDLVLKC